MMSSILAGSHTRPRAALRSTRASAPKDERRTPATFPGSSERSSASLSLATTYFSSSASFSSEKTIFPPCMNVI